MLVKNLTLYTSDTYKYVQMNSRTIYSIKYNKTQLKEKRPKSSVEQKE